MTFEGVEAVQGKTLTIVFSLANLHLASFAFFNFHLNGGHHGLTGIFIRARLTMIEHIPLTINLADRAVGVTIRGS